MTIGAMILGVILGGLINWFFSKRYYKKASEELKKEAGGLKSETEKLRKFTKMILQGMEIANLVTITKDPQGDPVGFVLRINVHDTISFSGSVSSVLTQTKKGEGGKKGGET
jgi:hypothetical protein